MAARDAIEYQGKLYSGGQLSVQSRGGGISQSGTLAAAGDVRLTAARSIQIVQEASLQLESQEKVRASGSLLSNKEVSAHGRRIDLIGAQVAASSTTLTTEKVASPCVSW